jgi:hypothetical protein
MSKEDSWLRLFNSQFFDEWLALRYGAVAVARAVEACDIATVEFTSLACI